MKSLSAFLTVAGLLISVAAAPGQAVPAEALIVTTGRASGAAPPTSARLRLGIESKASSAGTAAADNSARQRRLLATLARLGFGSSDARMTAYSVRADVDYETGKLRNYVASTDVEVAISNLATLGSVIDSSLAAGATEISNIDFIADSLPQLRVRLLDEALANARRDAEALAKAAGGRLGELVELSTIPFPQGPGGESYVSAMSVQTTDRFSAIGPRDVKTAVVVYTRWHLSK